MGTGHFIKTVLIVLCAVGLQPAYGYADSDKDETIAILNGEPISLSDIEDRVAFQVYRLRGNIYQLLKRETEEIVNQRLLAAEAERRGLTVDELLQAEVDDKVAPTSEKAVDEYLAAHPGDAGKGSQKRNRVHAYLSQKARTQRKLDFMASLREKVDFKFLLAPPQRPRTKISIDGEPWRGNPEAPVTLIHFASFTCKRCAQSTKMIERLMDELPNQIKWVHRNYFRINDERALSAAQIGESAHEQGKFWDFHDRLMAFGGQFELADIEQVARDLGLSPDDDKAVLKKERYLLNVKKDIRAASRSGVTTVPVIFVNGLYFSATFPYSRLKAMVTDELNSNTPSAKNHTAF